MKRPSPLVVPPNPNIPPTIPSPPVVLPAPPPPSVPDRDDEAATSSTAFTGDTASPGEASTVDHPPDDPVEAPSNVLTVRPAEVERGDFILGAPRLRVHRICLDCTIVERRAWLFHDRRGWVIARRPIASMVTVERDDAGDTSDWADPVGIVRPPSLRVVA